MCMQLLDNWMNFFLTEITIIIIFWDWMSLFLEQNLQSLSTLLRMGMSEKIYIESINKNLEDEIGDNVTIENISDSNKLLVHQIKL